MENWGSYILPAATRAWGPPSSTRGDEVRFGKQGSKSIRLDKGVWTDHESGESGGVVDLVKAFLIPEPEQGHGAVARYLNSEFGAPLDDAPSEDMSVFAPQMRETAKYTYLQADGTPHLIVTRTEDGTRKTFRQALPGNRNPSADPNYKPIPYRLDKIAATGGPIFIAEGEKCVEALEGLGLLATCNPGGANNWRPELSSYFKGRRVVVLPDNDEAGDKHARSVIASLQSCASEIRRVDLPGLEPKGDVADWIAAGGTRAELIELCKAAECVDLDDIKTHYKFADLVDILQREPAHWLIEGYLPNDALVAVYGEPGSFKSFLTLDMLLSLAHGSPFHGRELEQGFCVYVAGEGGGGLRKRLGAWHQGNDIEPKRGVIGIIEEPVPLSEEGAIELLIQDIEAMRRGQPVRVICFDTLARCMSGDENSATDMGEAIRALDMVKAHFECTVIAVHHAGKNADRGLRGSSALLGALDTALLCKRQNEMLQVSTTKMKDFEPGEPTWFSTHKIDYQPHVLDDIETSIKLSEMTDKPQVEEKMSAAQKAVLRALVEAMIECSVANAGGITWRSVSQEQWFATADGFQISNGNTASRKRAFTRSVEHLERIGRIGMKNNRAWTISQKDTSGQAMDKKMDNAWEQGIE